MNIISRTVESILDGKQVQEVISEAEVKQEQEEFDKDTLTPDQARAHLRNWIEKTYGHNRK